MNIRNKLLLGAGSIAAVPLVLTLYFLGTGSYNTAKDSLEHEVESKLTLLRDSKQQHIQEYIERLTQEVSGLARTQMVVDAFKGYKQTHAQIARDNNPTGKGLEEEITKQRLALQSYYTGEFAEEFKKRNAVNVPDMGTLVARLDPVTVAAQYHYIAANPQPLGKKDQMMVSADASAYSKVHARFHPGFEAVQKKFGYYDIFLIDSDGRVLLTVFKELDYMTNLNDGIAANTGLAEVWKKAVNAKSRDDIAISDYAQYLPSYYDQASFIAVPIFEGDTQIGVMAVQVPLDQITNVMTSAKQWKKIGLGESGETYLVGPDKLMRTEARTLIDNRSYFVDRFRKSNTPENVATMEKKSTSIGLQKVDTVSVNEALAGKSGVARYVDYLGNEVIAAYQPFEIRGLKWALIAEQNAEEVLAPVYKLGETTIKLGAAIALGVLILASAAIFWFLGRFMKPIQALQNTVKKVADGDYSARAAVKSGDELEDLGNALDNLLDDRITALSKAQRENETLNNSVINLLQTVALLAQKDLTAKAPVTEDIIGTVADSLNLLSNETGAVLGQVTQIAAKVEQASLRVKEQSDKVNATAEQERHELGKMVENLGVATAAMNEVAKLAQRSNQVAEQATTTTATALNTVNKTVSGMENIRQTISEAEKRIKRLGERSQEISGIVNLINTISERTHVLALNASMQAAVAGEAGRGFAVVAEEVQRLAESSRNATSQIATLVNNIQIETNETIGTVNRTIAQVVDGSTLAQESGEQMRATQETTNNLVELVKRIASSSQVQMKIAHELKQRVDEISASTVRTADQLKSQTEVTDTLLNYSERLVESVGVFKLPEQESDPSLTGDMARPNRRAA